MPLAAFLLCPVAVAFVFALLMVMAFQRMKGEHGLPHPSKWTQDVRSDLRPIREAYDAVNRSVAAGGRSTAVRVLGKEAMPEAKKLLQFAYRTAEKRREIRQLISTAGKQEMEAARLEMRLAQAVSEDERRSLEASIANYRRLQQKVGPMQDALNQTDVQLREAHAALVELHSQIVVAGTNETVGADTDELRETLGRIRDLSRSFEEVDQTLEDRLRG